MPISDTRKGNARHPECAGGPRDKELTDHAVLKLPVRVSVVRRHATCTVNASRLSACRHTPSSGYRGLPISKLGSTTGRLVAAVCTRGAARRTPHASP